jgi:hypothetical protein
MDAVGGDHESVPPANRDEPEDTITPVAFTNVSVLEGLVCGQVPPRWRGRSHTDGLLHQCG